MSFKYTCKNCNGEAKKTEVNAKKDKAGTLGSWRCTAGCKGKVKVSRSKV